MAMADAVRLPAPAPVEDCRGSASDPAPSGGTADPGGWGLLLVPTGICLLMFVVAALW
jgi:hypothetical protein